MTMIEKQIASAEKEIAKLTARLERCEAKYAKAHAKAVAMDAVEFKEIWNTPSEENKMFRKAEYVPFVDAHFENFSTERDVEETKDALKKANARLQKLTGKAEDEKEAAAEVERVQRIETHLVTMTAEERKAEYEKWLAEFKAECKKDGIEIDEANAHYVNGTTASGKRFLIYINSGFTTRSLHCYTLTINGETIFTSGDFSTAYARIRK